MNNISISNNYFENLGEVEAWNDELPEWVSLDLLKELCKKLALHREFLTIVSSGSTRSTVMTVFYQERVRDAKRAVNVQKIFVDGLFGKNVTLDVMNSTS